MQGTILKFDSEANKGLISGHDGNRYNFVRMDWTSDGEPTEGQMVDFDPHDNNAKEIIAIQSKPSRQDNVSEKSRLIAFLLCTLIVGMIGAHRFYVGKIPSGVAMLFTLGGLGIWTIIDWFMILAGTFRDYDNKLVTEWNPK